MILELMGPKRKSVIS